MWLTGLPGQGSGERDVRRAQRQRQHEARSRGDQGAVVCDLGRVTVGGGVWKWMEDTTSQDSEASFVVRAQEGHTQPAAAMSGELPGTSWGTSAGERPVYRQLPL